MNTSDPNSPDGRTILVAGGTGNVGRELVRALLERGASVIVPSRSPHRLAALREMLANPAQERFHGVVGDFDDERLIEQIRNILAGSPGGLSAVIASLGRFQAAASVLDAPLSQFDAVLDDYLRAHWRAAKALLSLLAPRGSYTLVNGPLAFQPGMPGTGLVSVATAAQAMLAQVLMEEAADGEAGPRINELVLYTPFGWGDEAAAQAPVSPQQAVDFIARLVAPAGDRIHGRSIHLNGRESLGLPG